MRSLEDVATAHDSISMVSYTPVQEQPAPPGCYWAGTAPFCAGSCDDGYVERDWDNCGDGSCCWTGYKVLCCKS